MCNRHYERARTAEIRAGAIVGTKGAKSRPLRTEIDGSVVRVYVRNQAGSEDGRYFMLDASDVHLLENRPWCINTATRHVSRSATEEKLHNRIMQPGPGMVVDHISGDPTDNRRCNLRIVPRQANAQNIKQPGVLGARGVRKWRDATGAVAGYTVLVRTMGRAYTGGRVFPTIAEAAAKAAEIRAAVMPYAVESRHVVKT